MQMTVLLFISGVVVLLVSTQILIKMTERISLSLKLSPLIIGLTVLSIITSLPELAVSVISALRGDMGLAMGNIIGSNIVNIFLVFAVGIFYGKLRVGTTKTQKNTYIMLGITCLFLFLYLSGVSSLIAGIILIISAVVITLAEYILGVSGRVHEDAKTYKKIRKYAFSAADIAKLSGALTGVVSGGVITVLSVEQMSVHFGLSTTVLGMSVTAIATSLPELMATIFSQRDHEDKITIGDVIGSNIYNLALIGGIILVISPWNTINTYETVMLILASVVFTAVVIVNDGKIIPKYTGLILLFLFVSYMYFLR